MAQINHLSWDKIIVAVIVLIDSNWVHFTETGNINYYLKYKENQKSKAENNANCNKGISDKGANNRGE